jgi:hypothetical protein
MHNQFALELVPFNKDSIIERIFHHVYAAIPVARRPGILDQLFYLQE